MMKIKSGGYALITIGDERPNSQSYWPYQPISCVMLVALEGDGAKSESTTLDSKSFETTAVISTIFVGIKSANVIGQYSPVELEITNQNETFIGDTNWLSGRHMHEFLTKYSQGLNFTKSTTIQGNQ